MAQSIEGPSASTLTRWTALIVIALGAGALLVYLQGVGVVARWSVSLVHPDSLFPPRVALPAIAIAGVLLLAFCGVMVRPRRSGGKPYDRLSLLLALFVLLAASYTIAVVRGWAVVPSVLVASAWIAAGAMFVVAARAAPLHHSLWLRVPFSVTFALVTLLLLEALVAAAGSPRFAALPSWLHREFTVIALGLAAVAGAVAALRYHDWLYPFTLGAFVALLPAVETTRTLAIAMWTFGAGMLLLAVLAGMLLVRDPRGPRPSRRRDHGYVTEIPAKMGKRRGRHRARAESRRYLLEADSSLMRL
ncbi:MAG: hypothetical protein IT518_05820 [Burkholderiales bacterium]|nr:hypothetical protein [Burkholderiales bacterium]